MGKYLKGILGPFSGLVGTVVGAIWKGQQVMRSRPVSSGKPPTEAQQRQRTTFAMVSRFLSPVNELLKIGFQTYDKQVSPFNAAFTLNSARAVTGTYPVISINYPQVVIAKGKLPAPTQFSAATDTATNLKLEWKNNAPADSTNGTDQLHVMGYNPMKQTYVITKNLAPRSAEQTDLVVPAEWSGNSVHIWVFFVTVNGKQSSDSAYIGTIPVA